MECCYFPLGNNLKFVQGNSLDIDFVQSLACLNLSFILYYNFPMNKEVNHFSYCTFPVIHRGCNMTLGMLHNLNFYCVINLTFGELGNLNFCCVTILPLECCIMRFLCNLKLAWTGFKLLRRICITGLVNRPAIFTQDKELVRFRYILLSLSLWIRIWWIEFKKVFDVFDEIIIQGKEIARLGMVFHQTTRISMNARKSLKIQNVRVRFKGTTSIQDKETQQLWIFWSSYPEAKTKLKLIDFQASFSLFTLQFLLNTKKFQGMKKFWWT